MYKINCDKQIKLFTMSRLHIDASLSNKFGSTSVSLQKWSPKYVQKAGSGSCILRVIAHGQISPDVICTLLKDAGYEQEHYKHLR